MQGGVDLDLRHGSLGGEVILVGVVDEVTAAYVREKVRHIGRATGNGVHYAEIHVAPVGDGGDVIVDVAMDLDFGSVHARVGAQSTMAALDRFESQLRRRLASESEVDAGEREFVPT
jgi:ribosome-associated translation inhibitor RaiA